RASRPRQGRGRGGGERGRSRGGPDGHGSQGNRGRGAFRRREFQRRQGAGHTLDARGAGAQSASVVVSVGSRFTASRRRHAYVEPAGKNLVFSLCYRLARSGPGRTKPLAAASNG